jgi:hypothetical protein
LNKNILNTGVQNYINKNIESDIMSVLLKKPLFEDITSQELAQQIESKKKCKKKLPTWFNTPEIYYPKKINIEQTSSEVTAAYKSEIIKGESLIDLTGGLGIDSFFFSKKIAKIFHCEIDDKLAEIAAHNFNVLGAKNIQNFTQNGLDILKESEQHFDCIYVDPSRRNKEKGKVFRLADCLPNIPAHLDLLFSRSNTVLIKTSPLLDFSIGIEELKFVKEIHVVAVANEVKELVWVLEKGFSKEIKIKTINFAKSGDQTLEFILSEEKNEVSAYSEALTYLYEPNAAILKSGAFKVIGNRFSLEKLHRHTHLYTSERQINFPGRCFKVEQMVSYNKKGMKELNIKKANISTRNFPESVSSIRKRFKIKEGGTTFLFFLMNHEENYVILLCTKI